MRDLRPKRLVGKVVVVPGAAEAEALTREGARVIATDLETADGGRRLDVTDGEEWAALAAELKDTYFDPLTAMAGLVTVAEVEDDLALVETAPGVTVEDITARTAAPLLLPTPPTGRRPAGSRWSARPSQDGVAAGTRRTA